VFARFSANKQSASAGHIDKSDGEQYILILINLKNIYIYTGFPFRKSKDESKPGGQIGCAGIEQQTKIPG
jgi:hypothetical protein